MAILTRNNALSADDATTLNSAVTTVDTKVDTMDTNVDDIETLLTTVDGKIDTIDGNVDDIETLLGTVDTKVDTIDAVVDLITANAPTKVAKTAATLPATGKQTLFTVTGTIEILEIVGHVTTAIQNQANDTKLVFDPTGVGADVDLCAALDIANDAVGTLYGITGTFADAMTDGLWAKKGQAAPVVVQDGVIALKTAATNTGATSWEILFRPLTTLSGVA